MTLTSDEIKIAQDEIDEIIKDMDITVGVCPGCSYFDGIQYELTEIYVLIKAAKIAEALEKFENITCKMNRMQMNCPGCGRIESIHSKLSHLANFVGKFYERKEVSA